MTDPREAKLPVWAQQELAAARMRRDEAVAELSRVLAPGPDSSPFYLRSWDRPALALPRHYELVAKVPGGKELVLDAPRRADGHLEVRYAHGSLAVFPVVSNVVRIEPVDR